MATLGVKCYEKALTFTSHKCDLDRVVEKASGTTLEDVVLYVHHIMYMELNQKDESDVDSESEDVVETETTNEKT